MKRIVRSAAALAALLGAPHAAGLGLGDATISSDMSSPLRVSVPLVGLLGSGVELDALRVDVPGVREHAALGYDEPIRPRDLRVQLSPDGRHVVLSTPSPTREPVLRFAVRVEWPGGQSVREYELIIDPPAVARPVRRGGAAPVVVRAPVTPRRGAAVALAAPRSPAPPRAGTRYGPVAAGDTLHAIARAAYPDRGGDLAPVMRALVERNPAAFVAADPGRLLMGAFLDLPDDASVAATVTQPAAPAAASAPSPSLAQQSYTVTRGDTLYAIARRIAEPGHDLAAVVQSLYERNRGAFIAGDRDRLQAGAVLRLPGVTGTPARGDAPRAPVASEAGERPAVADLRARVESTAARIAEERARSSEMRERLDALLAEMQSLRARDAELTVRSDALAAELERRQAQTPAAAAADVDATAAVAAATPDGAPSTARAPALTEVTSPAPAKPAAASEAVTARTLAATEVTAPAAAAAATGSAAATDRAPAPAAARVATVGVATPASASAAVSAAVPATVDTTTPGAATREVAVPEQASTELATRGDASATGAALGPIATRQAPDPAGETEAAVPPAGAEAAGASRAAAAPARRAVAAPGVVVNPAVQQRPERARPARRLPAEDAASGTGLAGLAGPLAAAPLPWLVGGLFAVALLVLLAARALRSGRGDETTRRGADEEATAQKLAEVRERHSASGRLHAVAPTAPDKKPKKSESATVHLTDAARAANLAKEAAVHLAYEDYSAARACISEAIRLDPHRDEHKMVLVTVYECTGEQAKARALVDDLVARREQLPGDLRKQVEQLRLGAAE